MPAETFSDRIKLLIMHVGSPTEIARMCGFSEGVVRSWRDGYTDPSRARCVTLARTLGVSLLWVVAGEGRMLEDESAASFQEHRGNRSKVRGRALANNASTHTRSIHEMDAQRLNVSLKILQSQLHLADSELTLADNTDLLAEIYKILSAAGEQIDTQAMLAFNRRLALRMRQAESAETEAVV